MRKLAIAILTCALALMAIVVLLLATLDIGRYRGLIEAELRRAIGRDVALSGPIHLELGLHPTLVVEQVAIANPPWASGRQFLTAERVEAQMALLPLLLRQAEVDRLLVSGADIALETAADGRRNWTFAGIPPSSRPRSAWLVGSTAAAMPAAAAGVSVNGWTPFIRKLHVRDSRVTFRDAAGGIEHELHLATADLAAAAAEAPIAVDFQGAMDGSVAELHGQVCPLTVLLAVVAPCPVTLDGQVAGLEAQVTGNVDRSTATGLDLQITVSAPDMAALQSLAGPYLGRFQLPDGTGPLRLEGRLTGEPANPSMENVTLGGRIAGLDLQVHGSIADLVGVGGVDLALMAEGDPVEVRALMPTLPPGELSLAAQLRGGPDAWRIENLSLRQGSTELAGSLEIAIDDQRPMVKAMLTSPRLSLPLPVSASGAADSRRGNVAAPASLFSDEPFDLAWLQAVDADFSLQAARVVVGPIDLRDLGIEATLQAGVLDVGSVDASIANSPLKGSLVVNTGQKPTTAQLRLDSPALDLGGVLGLLKMPDLVQAHGRLDVDLRAAGASPQAMARSLEGRIEAVFENGRLNADAASQPLLGLQRFLGELTRPLQGEWAEMRCLAAVFVVADGVARPDPLVVDSSISSTIGTGKIDIGGERYALTITSRAHGLAIGVPVRVTGPLEAPDLGVDEKRAVEEGVGAILGKLLPPAAAGTRDTVTAGNPCPRSPGNPASGTERDHPGSAGTVLQGFGQELRKLLPR